MRSVVKIALIAILAFPVTSLGWGSSRYSSGNKPETRCGWFANPTPGNAWLTDSDAEWTIGVQGGYQAEGDWPNFKSSHWRKTNGNYGYGCACMKVTSNTADKQIIKIFSGYSKPLSACRKDPKLKVMEFLGS